MSIDDINLSSDGTISDPKYDWTAWEKIVSMELIAGG